MSEQGKPSGFFWSTAATEAGGQLTETEFFAAMDDVFKYNRTPAPLIVSRGTIEKGRAEALRQFALADDVRKAWHRTRRWRIFRRHRLARAEVQHLRDAVSLEHTFGR